MNAIRKRERLHFEFNLERSLDVSINELLISAGQNGKAGVVAHHLVGAVLQNRYPWLEVENPFFHDVEDPRCWQGDFIISDTAFFVTVDSMHWNLEECANRIKTGMRVYLLATDNRIELARHFAEHFDISEKIIITSIESFITQTISFMAAFSKQKFLAEIRALVETYNRRVDLIEGDKSLLIKIPKIASRCEN